MDSLPKHMVHLGDGLFTLVKSFLKETRVHIRVYTTDDILLPTKEGVSMKPEVWSSLVTTLRNFPAREDPYAVIPATYIFNRKIFKVDPANIFEVKTVKKPKSTKRMFAKRNKWITY
ncbi:hypothetical protein AVEN_235005-1 [Araneus ventricosus]|uniref:Transcriptional coactivator p15 (PC4) C-terminal domain-containing protein n=1 Tax=Araneus ventricosus TaxID=182803 RepID=A0A4Y2FM35_ARAVE|nr:hypothetical protein AVEN_235005-1 [Araneus ventricosus]